MTEPHRGARSPLRQGLRRIVDALQLGLFDAPEDTAVATSPAWHASGTPRQEPQSVLLPESQLQLQPQSQPQPQLPTQPRPDPSFAHPDATRELVVDGVRVAFRLVRVRRRSIGFVVDADGLTVRAAHRVTLREIDAAVHAKRTWIVARLAEQRERARRAAAARIVWRDGTAIDHLGDKLVVVLDPTCAGVAGHATLGETTTAGGASARILAVALPRDAAPERIRDAVQSWMQREARRVFAERVAHFAALLGVRVQKLSLSSAATRWGSANANGAIRLHWRLIEHPLATIDYVVAHELAHLREMNHSARFWKIVESVVPDYRAVRRGLRTVEQPIDPS
jgi:predicted metal-dependent hydrolase